MLIFLGVTVAGFIKSFTASGDTASLAKDLHPPMSLTLYKVITGLQVSVALAVLQPVLNLLLLHTVLIAQKMTTYEFIVLQRELHDLQWLYEERESSILPSLKSLVTKGLSWNTKRIHAEKGDIENQIKGGEGPRMPKRRDVVLSPWLAWRVHDKVQAAREKVTGGGAGEERPPEDEDDLLKADVCLDAHGSSHGDPLNSNIHLSQLHPSTDDCYSVDIGSGNSRRGIPVEIASDNLGSRNGTENSETPHPRDMAMKLVLYHEGRRAPQDELGISAESVSIPPPCNVDDNAKTGDRESRPSSPAKSIPQTPPPAAEIGARSDSVPVLTPGSVQENMEAGESGGRSLSGATSRPQTAPSLSLS